MAEATWRRAMAEKIEAGIRNKLEMTENQVYRVAAPAPLPGMMPRVVQVIIGGGRPTGPGVGGQEGGSLVREVNVTIAIWHRCYFDRKGRTREALMADADGLDDLLESVKDLFKFTTLGGYLIEPMIWTGDTDPEFVDADDGLLTQQAKYTAKIAEELPITLTLDSEDLV